MGVGGVVMQPATNLKLESDKSMFLVMGGLEQMKQNNLQAAVQ